MIDTTAAFAAPATAAAVGLGYWINRRIRGFLPDDPPGAGRKQHSRPIPLAGIILAPVAITWLCFAHEWWAAAAALTAALIGFVDDRGKEHGRDLGWRPKAAFLFLAAAFAAMAVTDPITDPWRFAATIAFAFVLTNATNFLDNMDGVASSLSAVSLLLVTAAAGPFAAIGFAALGFLFFNWPRPLVFLGDAGAYLLGILLATAVSRAALTDWTALGAVAIQFTDFAQVVLARVVLGVAPWVGDRRHLTHIIHHRGVPKVAIAPLFAALGVLLWFGVRANWYALL